MNLRYEPATQADIQPLFDLSKNLIDTYEDLRSIDYEKVLSWLRRKLAQNISGYTCVYAGEEKVAYFRLCHEPRQLELDDLYVLPAYQNRGIGSAILEKILAQAQKPVYLYVFNKNSGAIRLYRRYGFVTEKEVSPTRSIMVKKD